MSNSTKMLNDTYFSVQNMSFCEEAKSEERDLSKLTTNEKKAFLLGNFDLDEIVGLIPKGFTIKLDELRTLHDTKIPVSFYSHFGISPNDFVSTMVRRSQNRELQKQLEKTILEEDIEIKHIQKFLSLYNGISVEILRKIQEKYDIFNTPNLCVQNEEHDNFVDVYIFWLGEDFEYKEESEVTKNLSDKIDYLLDHDERYNWNLSPILDFAIQLNNKDVTEKLLERGIVPEGGWYYEKVVPDVEIFKLVAEHIGEDKIYDLLLNIFRKYKTYNMKAMTVIMNYMASIKDLYQVMDEIASIQKE